MITKEKVKNKIDQLSEADLNRVYLFIVDLSKEKTGKEKVEIRSLKLGGKLDTVNIRSVAYE